MANSIKRCMTIMAIEMTNKYVTKYGEEGGLLYGFPEVVFLFLILFFFLMF